MDLLYLVGFFGEFVGFLSRLYIAGIIGMVDGWRLFRQEFDRLGAGVVEERAIVAYDAISTFPGIGKISLKPFYPSEINKVRWLVQEQEVGREQQDLRERDFGALSAGDLGDPLIEESRHAESLCYAHNSSFVGIPIEVVVAIEQI